MTTGVTVDFNANLARFTTSVEKATADLGKFQSKAESVSAKIGSTFQGLASGLTVGAFTAWIKGSIDAADQMNDLSQRIGIGIKDLAAFELASQQSGTSLESVARGVKGLSGFMLENSAELKKAGITATDANGAIIQLADLFEAMPDGVEKTTLAVKLFGKAGMEMIPLLNQGGQGLAEAAEKSKAYGEKLAAMAPNADKFNDQLAELALNSKITGMNIADYLLPGLIGMSQWLNDLAAGGDKARTALEFLSEKSPLFSGLVKLHELLNGGEARSKGFTGEKNALGLPISEAEKAAKDLAAFDAATDAYMKQREAKLKQREAKQRALRLLGKTATEPAGKAAKHVKSAEDYALRIQEAVAGAVNNSAIVKSRELADQIAALDKLFFESGLDADIYTSALEKLVHMTASVSDQEEKLARLLEATPTAQLEKAREDMQLLADAFEQWRITEEQFNEAAIARLGQTGTAIDEMTEFARQAARNMQDAMAEGFFDIMQGRFDRLGSSFKATLDRMVANAIAADLSNKLFGDFGKSGKLGGWAGDWLGKLFPPGYGDIAGVAAGVPAYAEGISYVPRTGLALIHQGERIIPADQNRGGFGGNIIIHVNGAGNAQDVRRAAGHGAREALAAFSGAQRYA